MSRLSRRPVALAILTVIGSAAALSGCSAANGSGGGASTRTITVVAAENFWGSIASQLGGAHADVTSIIVNPNTDPHSYEPTAQDGRTIATAQFVIENGVGYDPWVANLLAADASSPHVLNVGQLVGIPTGGNPHRWYDPDNVTQVIGKITAEYESLDPTDRSYFAARENVFEHLTLDSYHQLIAQIRARYAGTPIGASESIVSPLAQALGLRMLTPASFLDAISEGTEPTAADKATIDRQIATRQIKVYVYNSQNATPDVQAQVHEARAVGIPVTTVTETLAPANATFEAWQVSELRNLQAALAAATGR